MDIISQSLLGAVATQNTAKKKNLIVCTIIGLLAGLAPDLDVLIMSDVDPLLSLEYHRQFTHSLIFIPIGGLICATVFHWLFARKWLSFRATYIFSTIGYATHPFLDVATAYGTQLFWPFSDVRIAVGNIAIIDLMFTLPILFLVAICAIKRSRLLARITVIWIVFYLSLGLVQKLRAEAVGYDLAISRGHQPERLSAKPSFANILIWKNIYEYNGNFYVDAVRVGLNSRIYTGESAKKLDDVATAFPWLDSDSQQAKDIERFRWFTDGFLAQRPSDPTQLVDIRYSVLPNELGAPWWIVVDPTANTEQHVLYQGIHKIEDGKTKLFFDMLFGRNVNNH